MSHHDELREASQSIHSQAHSLSFDQYYNEEDMPFLFSPQAATSHPNVNNNSNSNNNNKGRHSLPDRSNVKKSPFVRRFSHDDASLINGSSSLYSVTGHNHQQSHNSHYFLPHFPSLSACFTSLKSVFCCCSCCFPCSQSQHLKPVLIAIATLLACLTLIFAILRVGFTRSGLNFVFASGIASFTLHFWAVLRIFFKLKGHLANRMNDVNIPPITGGEADLERQQQANGNGLVQPMEDSAFMVGVLEPMLTKVVVSNAAHLVFFIVVANIYVWSF